MVWIFGRLAHRPPQMSVMLEHWLPQGPDVDLVSTQEKPWLDQGAPPPGI